MFGSKTDTSTKSHFKSKSTFIPGIYAPSIATFDKLILSDLKNIERCVHKTGSNMSYEDRKILFELANDKVLVIKSADKGGGIVVMNRLKYVHVAQPLLDDRKNYTPIQNDPSRQASRLIRITVTEAANMGLITEAILKFLLPEETHTYFLQLIKDSQGAGPIGGAAHSVKCGIIFIPIGTM